MHSWFSSVARQVFSLSAAMCLGPADAVQRPASCLHWAWLTPMWKQVFKSLIPLHSPLKQQIQYCMLGSCFPTSSSLANVLIDPLGSTGHYWANCLSCQQYQSLARFHYFYVDLYLKSHPGDSILLWAEDSLPFPPAVHVGLLCHHPVVGHAVGRVPVIFWHLDFWGVLVIWLHWERLHFFLQRLLLHHRRL